MRKVTIRHLPTAFLISAPRLPQSRRPPVPQRPPLLHRHFSLTLLVVLQVALQVTIPEYQFGMLLHLLVQLLWLINQYGANRFLQLACRDQCSHIEI